MVISSQRELDADAGPDPPFGEDATTTGVRSAAAPDSTRTKTRRLRRMARREDVTTASSDTQLLLEQNKRRSVKERQQEFEYLRLLLLCDYMILGHRIYFSSCNRTRDDSVVEVLGARGSVSAH